MKTDLRSSSPGINDRERLIVALDVPSGEEARNLVKTLGGSIDFYKVGLELFLSGDAFELLDWLVERGKKIFVDLKFFDVPATVARAVKQLHGRNVTFATVHGNDAMMKAAAEEGLIFPSGSVFFIDGTQDTTHFRLAYTGESFEHLKDSGVRLHRAFESILD